MFICVQVLDPCPSLVASKLLARKSFKEVGKQFNMIACSWLQFMIHDWVDHLEDTQQVAIASDYRVLTIFCQSYMLFFCTLGLSKVQFLFNSWNRWKSKLLIVIQVAVL